MLGFTVYNEQVLIYSPTCSPLFHQFRYQFEVSNRLGSVKGSVALVVHKGEGEEDDLDLRRDFESNPVTQEEFGEYVASLHSCNSSTFILQFEVLMRSQYRIA